MSKPVNYEQVAQEVAADSDHWRRLYFEMQDERDKLAEKVAFMEQPLATIMGYLPRYVADHMNMTIQAVIKENTNKATVAQFERDALRAQIERMQRVVDAAFWFAGYVPLQRGLKVQQKRLSDALAALDALTPAGGGDAGEA